MRKPALVITSTAAVALTICSAAMSPIGTGAAAGAPPDTSGGVRAPFTSRLRACDSTLRVNNFWGKMGAGTGEALIRSSGNTVVAEVQFVNTRALNTHYDVVLVQAPRPASSPCGPGAPGVATTGMDTDAAGRATVTVSDALHSGTTGAWLNITRPSPHSQDPAEYYTTVLVAPI